MIADPEQLTDYTATGSDPAPKGPDEILAERHKRVGGFLLFTGLVILVFSSPPLWAWGLAILWLGGLYLDESIARRRWWYIVQQTDHWADVILQAVAVRKYNAKQKAKWN